MRRLHLAVTALFLMITISGKSQGELRNSVLADGDWYKMAVMGDSVYRITFDFLSSMGIDPLQVDPKNIRIFGNGGRQLPQSNNETRPVDLTENSTQGVGLDDGIFNPGDAILFFGQGPTNIDLDSSSRTVLYSKNDYSDTSFYFLNIGSEQAQQIQNLPSSGTNYPIISTFFSYAYLEKDLFNLVGSGREWFGQKFSGGPVDFSFNFPGFISANPIQVTSGVMARTFAPAEFRVLVNDLNVATQLIGSVPNGTYSTRGRENTETFIVSSAPAQGEVVKITLDYRPSGEGTSIGYLNYLTVGVYRNLALYGNQTPFVSWESTLNATSTYQLDGVASSNLIWNITDPYHPANQEFEITNNQALFGSVSQALKRYVVFNADLVPEPIFVGSIPNQDIQGMGAANLIIVTHPSFLSEAQRLADLRRSNDGLTVHVVTTTQVFNEFSSGIPDVTAIRDYLKYLWDLDSSDSGLRYVLLFGKGTYDYKSRTPFQTNFVPIYESRNSLHPIYSYSSDDYYGFMEDDEGEWIESSTGDHTMEIGIGRLPIKSMEEARDVVDKYYTYSIDPNSLGDWRNIASFVADDGDNNLHQRQANMLADTVENRNSNLNINKIYLDAFPQEVLPGREISPDTNEEINKVVERGSLIVNFTGHGNENQWTHESILDRKMIASWENSYRLPLFITATCEFGRHDDPERISAGEEIVLRKDGGAIALVTAARPVFASQNYQLNNAFYQAAFESENSGHQKRLGDIFRETKNSSLSGSVNRNFSLLGDPSLKLAFPENHVSIDSINGQRPAVFDTLRALSSVEIKGGIEDSDGNSLQTFSGIVDVILFEKSAQKSTLGNGGPVYLFEERDNIIFRGSATVSNGSFQIEFVMPKNISYQFGTGKISLYAYSQEEVMDASGSSFDIIIGGTAKQFVLDSSPPTIQLFMGDTTFQPGGIVQPSTTFLARIYDDSGISISQSGVGQDLQAVLDEDSIIYLNEFYKSQLDSYQSGWVQYPINNLEKGPHTITLKVWDTHNNPAEATINFMVSENGEMIINELRNYPNPFKESTKFVFRHNRPGEDLEVHLAIFDSNGSIVKESMYQLYDSFFETDAIEWDGKNSTGQKLRPGIYFYRVFARSMEDGAGAQKTQKLIIY